MKAFVLRITALLLIAGLVLALPGCALVKTAQKVPVQENTQQEILQENEPQELPTQATASSSILGNIIGWFAGLFGGGQKEPEAAKPVEQDLSVYQRFQQLVEQAGYDNCAFVQADVTDHDMQEVVGICQKDSSWYGLVLALIDGEYRQLFCENMTQQAMYLVKYGQQSCIMTYLQSMVPAADGSTTITNQYQLFRLQATGEKTVLEENAVTYQNTSSEATEVSAFFNACNAYLAEAQVVVDPYRLQGKEFMDSADYGTPPTPSEEPSQENAPALPQEETLGFVQIKDPKSWLNLREGPGTEYPCVYTQPGNKKSLVKQAQGAPVTILETIETGDSKNPVWVKVRITYAGQEIVGYSSKKCIRVAE